jgi:hypothetical protein
MIYSFIVIVSSKLCILILIIIFLYIDGNLNVCDLEMDDKEDTDAQYKIIDGDEKVEEPKELMVFSSEEEVCLYYRTYAKQVGFGVVKRGKKKSKGGGAKYITLACARQGTIERSTSSNAVKPNPTIKTGCKAKINARRVVDGKWFLTTVVVDHNHCLSPGKARFLDAIRI